jgi:hypothetical protein
MVAKHNEPAASYYLLLASALNTQRQWMLALSHMLCVTKQPLFDRAVLHRWSNLTFDSLVLENMAPGDARSAEVARPLSVSSANNLWALYYNREEMRLILRNLTFVVGSQTELDYYLYW